MYRKDISTDYRFMADRTYSIIIWDATNEQGCVRTMGVMGVEWMRRQESRFMKSVCADVMINATNEQGCMG